MDIRRIIAGNPGGIGGMPVPRQDPGLPAAEVPIPPISYGQVEKPTRVRSEWPADSYAAQSYACNDLDRFTLFGATVHGEQGVITVGDFLVWESLYHVHLGLTGFIDEGDGVYSLEDHDNAIEVANASYAMCGAVANRNYAHWWIDVASSLQVPPFGSDEGDATILMPKLRGPWQMGTLDLLPEAKARAIFVGENSRVYCHSLTYMPQLVMSDPNPHPSKRFLLEEVRRRAGAVSAPTRRIYVSRKDATKRRLTNEDAVIALLERYGFEAQILTGMSVVEQVRLFSAATHIVGAHGAGLSNVIFCRPGTRLLEFHMHDNLIWSIRRMAALAEMQYGCIFGSADQEHVHLDARGWEVDIAELERTMAMFVEEAVAPARDLEPVG